MAPAMRLGADEHVAAVAIGDVVHVEARGEGEPRALLVLSESDAEDLLAALLEALR